MTQHLPPYRQALSKHDPIMAEYVDTGRELIMADGALSAKVKTLMAMLCDAMLTHDEGVQIIADRARGMGASEEEIAETLRVAFWAGGLPALVTGLSAFPE